ncbi:hypothetical protein HK104_009174 [Borealophlyctis nickersoniae]|nr:hypothetical protein HK104_009174 [Borealophlyctis nickersoniae]
MAKCRTFVHRRRATPYQLPSPQTPPPTTTDFVLFTDVVATNLNLQHLTLSNMDTESEGEAINTDSEVSEDEEPTLSDLDFIDDREEVGQPLSDDDYTPSSSEEEEDKLANASLQRYVDAEHPAKTSVDQKRSALNTMKELDLLKHFADPITLDQTLRTARKRKADSAYSSSQQANCTKTLSKVAQYLTKEEKARFVDTMYDAKGDALSLHKRAKFSKEDKADVFRVLVQLEYQAINGLRMQDYANGNEEQKMTERQTNAYQPHAVLVEKLLNQVDVLLNRKMTAQVRYEFQFVVAGLIFSLADRNHRRDISETWLVDGEGRNVVLRFPEDATRTPGILIKSTNKTKEQQVFLPFTNEHLLQAVKILVDYRKKSGKEHLFLKKDGDVPPNQVKWFGETFTKVMRKLNIGDNLTMGIFQMAYGIELSRMHDGTLVSEKRIEDAMGHSWEIHQHRYNLTALQDGSLDEGSEDEEQ